jgi:hypothetical protein
MFGQQGCEVFLFGKTTPQSKASVFRKLFVSREETWKLIFFLSGMFFKQQCFFFLFRMSFSVSYPVILLPILRAIIKYPWGARTLEAVEKAVLNYSCSVENKSIAWPELEALRHPLAGRWLTTPFYQHASRGGSPWQDRVSPGAS